MVFVEGREQKLHQLFLVAKLPNVPDHPSARHCFLLLRVQASKCTARINPLLLCLLRQERINQYLMHSASRCRSFACFGTRMDGFSTINGFQSCTKKMVEMVPNLEGLKVVNPFEFTQEKSVQISACGIGHGLCFEALVRCLGKISGTNATNNKRKTSDYFWGHNTKMLPFQKNNSLTCEMIVSVFICLVGS